MLDLFQSSAALDPPTEIMAEGAMLLRAGITLRNGDSRRVGRDRETIPVPSGELAGYRSGIDRRRELTRKDGLA